VVEAVGRRARAERTPPTWSRAAANWSIMLFAPPFVAISLPAVAPGAKLAEMAFSKVSRPSILPDTSNCMVSLALAPIWKVIALTAPLPALPLPSNRLPP
jgi:hypothetical protein